MNVYRQRAVRTRARLVLAHAACRVLALCASLMLACVAPSAHVAQETGATSARQEEDAAARRQERAARQEDSPRGRVDWMRRLNLTPEQVAQIGEIRRQAEADGRPLVRRLSRARRALDEAIYSESSNEALIEESAREVAAAQAELTRLRAATELRVRRVLTPEQLNLFRDLRRQAQSRQTIRRERRREVRQQRRRQRRPAQDALDKP